MYFPLSTFMCVFTFLHPCLLASSFCILCFSFFFFDYCCLQLFVLLYRFWLLRFSRVASLFSSMLSPLSALTHLLISLWFSLFSRIHSALSSHTHTHTDKRHANPHILSRTRISIFITTTELFYCFLVVFFFCLPFAFLDLFFTRSRL